MAPGGEILYKGVECWKKTFYIGIDAFGNGNTHAHANANAYNYNSLVIFHSLVFHLCF